MNSKFELNRVRYLMCRKSDNFVYTGRDWVAKDKLQNRNLQTYTSTEKGDATIQHWGCNPCDFYYIRVVESYVEI